MSTVNYNYATPPYEDGPVKRRTQVEQQLSDMEEALDRLHKEAELLIERLHPLLRREGGPAEGGPVGVADSLVPLAEGYREHVRRVEMIAGLLGDAGRRLEL